jgi:hypothetical protein
MKERNGNELSGEPITLEQLFLATRVLIERHGQQGRGWPSDEDMLRDAYEFVRTANEVLLNPPPPSPDHKKAWAELCAKFGYDRQKKHQLVPYDELARKIVGRVRTKGLAATRLQRFIHEHEELRLLAGIIRRFGIRKDLIPQLAKKEKEFHKERMRGIKVRNAQQPRSEKKSKKVL